MVVHHETDERFWTSVGRTRSDRLLVIGSGSKTTTEYRILDAADPTGEFRVVTPRRQGVEYGVEHAVIGGEDRLLVLHNEDAENYALAKAPLDATGHEQWEPLIPHDPAVRLEDVDAFAGHLVVTQRSEGSPSCGSIELTDEGLGDDYLVRFEDPVYTVGAGGNPEFHQPTIRLGYTTMATPPRSTTSTYRPARSPCSSAPRCSPTPSSGRSTPTATSSTAPGRPRPTAPGCRCRWCFPPGHRATAARRS